MIKIENINKTFNNKVHALKEVNLTINKGEIFGIIGYSGAGKSTLLRSINRLEKVDSGHIYLDGLDITNLKDDDLAQARKNIGMIFQHFNLLNQKTVFDNIALALIINNYTKKEIDDRVVELLDYVGLLHKKNSFPSQLSGGEKQRVAIARALANKPKILLSDEGTSALDPKTTQSILNLLKQINNDLGITIVMITHQMEVVKEICQRVAIMEDGRIIEENTVENLFTNPQTKTANLFINSLTGDVENELNYLDHFKGKVLRLSFLGDSAKKPIISEIIKSNQVDINILSGNINKLQSTNVGNLIVEFIGSEIDIQEAISKLEENKVIVEVI